MIKNIVHRGMSNEIEQEVSMRLKLDVIEKNQKSIAFLVSDDVREIKKRM